MSSVSRCLYSILQGAKKLEVLRISFPTNEESDTPRLNFHEVLNKGSQQDSLRFVTIQSGMASNATILRLFRRSCACVEDVFILDVHLSKGKLAQRLGYVKDTRIQEAKIFLRRIYS